MIAFALCHNSCVQNNAAAQDHVYFTKFCLFCTTAIAIEFFIRSQNDWAIFIKYRILFVSAEQFSRRNELISMDLWEKIHIFRKRNKKMYPPFWKNQMEENEIIYLTIVICYQRMGVKLLRNDIVINQINQSMANFTQIGCELLLKRKIFQLSEVLHRKIRLKWTRK